MPNSSTLVPVTFLRFAKLIGAVIAATVGLIFLIVGINLLSSQQWATATGTVQSCTISHTTAGSTHVTHQLCNVTWQEAGVQHTDQVDFGSKPIYNGQTYQLKVSGNSAVLPSPAWVAILTFVVGLALIVTCVFLVLRSRRQRVARA